MLAGAIALAAQTTEDPSDILSRARYEIVAAMRRLPKYTCVETIDRSYYVRSTPLVCDRESAERKTGRASTRLRLTDRVRIEVAQGEGQQMQSWPGADAFAKGEIDQLIDRGPSSTGGFGGYLIDLFENGNARFTFEGAKSEGTRRVYTYGYRVDQDASRYKVRTADGWVVAGYDGDFDIDTGSLQLLRITINTLSLPPETGLCEAASTLEYAAVRIGESDFLLPQVSKMHLEYRGTLVTDNISAFSACREYRAQAARVTSDVQRSSQPVIPEGFRIDAVLDAAIDTDIAARGDEVTATVVGTSEPGHDPALDSGAKVRPMGIGGVIHGRITRMEHAPGAYFIIAIRWDSITIQGVTAPFGAAERKAIQIPATLGTIEGRKPPPPSELPTWVISTSARRHTIPAGTQIGLIAAGPGAESRK
jgi:hypothetical protein